MDAPEERLRFPVWMCVWWWIAVVLAAPLFIRLLWEQTLLTWKQGRQMVGFTVAHQHLELLFAALVGDLLLIGWLVAAIVLLARRKKKPTPSAAVFLAIPLIAIAVSFIPYDFWARLGGIE